MSASRYFIIVVAVICGILMSFEGALNADPTAAARTRDADRECARFFTRTGRIEGVPTGREIFSSHATALIELMLVEGYPGLDPDVLRASSTGCDSLRFDGLLARLRSSAEAYGFSEKQRARVSSVVQRAERVGLLSGILKPGRVK